MKKIFIFFAALAFVGLSGFGCISFKDTTVTTTSGIYKTTDQGEIWEKKSSFPTAEGVGNVAHVGVNVFAIDPSDHLAIYAGTESDGLLYSYDGAEAWNSANELDAGPIAAVVIDPEDKCVVYAASRNKIYKTEDCSRTFEQTYYETRTETEITDIEIDWYNHTVVYAATSEGDLLKSTDAGASWSPLYRFEGDIYDILIDPFDSRVLYVGTKRKGLWKTIDNGENWAQLNQELKEFKDTKDIYQVVADKTSEGTIIIATKYGLLRTYDAGSTWSAIPLLTPPSEAEIQAMAINPREGKEIYYVTESTIYKTLDAGQSWITKKVPASGRYAQALIVDPENGKVIYLGLTAAKK